MCEYSHLIECAYLGVLKKPVLGRFNFLSPPNIVPKGRQLRGGFVGEAGGMHLLEIKFGNVALVWRQCCFKCVHVLLAPTFEGKHSCPA